MKGRCCRSMPRCARCPVLEAALVRRPHDPGSTAALVEAVFGGGRPKLVPCVEAALTELEDARAAGRRFARQP